MSALLLAPALAFLAGLCAGTLYFALLWRAVRRLTGGGAGWRFGVDSGLRLGLVLGGLGLLLWTGATLPTILAAGLGVALARILATRIAEKPLTED